MFKTYKIVFLGNSSVGKTTLISQYLFSKTPNPAPTIGMDSLNATFDINGSQVRLQLWDTAGQERFHSIIGNYTRNTFLAIIVFAIDDPESLQNLSVWINDFALSHSKKDRKKILVVANKMDLKVDSFNEILDKANGICETYGAKLVMTSALDRSGIADLITAISGYILEDLEHGHEEAKEHNAIIATPSRRGCC